MTSVRPDLFRARKGDRRLSGIGRTLVPLAAGHDHEARPVERGAEARREDLADDQTDDAAAVEHMRQTLRAGVVADLEDLEPDSVNRLN